MDALRTTCTRGSHAQIHVAGMSMLARCLSLMLTGLTLTGCRGNVDLLEARLRSQEDLLSRTQADLSQVRGELVASQSLTGRLHRKLAEASQGMLLQ